MARHFDFTDRGNATNEDFARAGALPGGCAYGVVIDGATGLSGEPLFPGRFATNAQWLAQTVGGETCRALEAGASAADALSRAVLAARAEYEAALGRPVGLADPDAVPSATLALAVVGGGRRGALGPRRLAARGALPRRLARGLHRRDARGA